MFDPKAAVNLYETAVDETIDVPDGANITSLKILQAKGLFSVVEGTILPKLSTYDSVTYVPNNGLVTMTFDVAITSEELTSTTNGESTDDLVVEDADGNYYAGTFAAVSEATTITGTITTDIDLDVTVTINQTGATKIVDANLSSVDPAAQTMDVISSIATISAATYTVAEASAVGILTLTGVVSDGETVTIGTDIYEFDNETNVTEGNILVDVTGDLTAPAAITALAAAILASGDGTYTGVDGASDTLDVEAATAGPSGNLIATTYTTANGSFGGIVLAGGEVGTITDVPGATAKATFEADITADESGATIDYADVQATVTTADTVVVTAQNATTVVTYTITVT